MLPRKRPLRAASAVPADDRLLTDQGQGGGQAIEDAEALGVTLPLGTSPTAENIASRLALTEKIRYERASKIQVSVGRELANLRRLADLGRFPRVTRGRRPLVLAQERPPSTPTSLSATISVTVVHELGLLGWESSFRRGALRRAALRSRGCLVYELYVHQQNSSVLLCTSLYLESRAQAFLAASKARSLSPRRFRAISMA